MSAPLIDLEPVRAAPRRLPEQAGSFVRPLAALGLALTSVGLLDLAFAWLPSEFGVGEWEFGTVSRTFDAYALLTVGWGLLLSAALLRSSALALRLLALVFAVTALGLLGALALYALNVPLALRAMPAESKSALVRAIMRTGAFAAIYITLYGWLAWFAWHRAGARSGGRT